MSIFRDLVNRYKKECGTTENHFDSDLKTRYFKGNSTQIIEAVEEMLQADPSVRTISISNEHGEIAAEISRNKSFFVIITVITVRPLETAVDINISTENFLITGINPLLKREVQSIYKTLEKKYSFLGAGKNANH